MLLPGIRMLKLCAIRKRSQLAALAGILVAVGLLAGCAHEDKKLPPSRYTTLPPKEVPAFLNGTIFQQVDTANTEPFIVNSYGLVVNLSGPTGDSRNVPMNVKQFIIRQMVKNGIGSTRAVGESTQIQPEEMLKDKRNAIVRVDGPIPPGAR